MAGKHVIMAVKDQALHLRARLNDFMLALDGVALLGPDDQARLERTLITMGAADAHIAITMETLRRLQ